MANRTEVRVLVVGKSGSGKSTVCNKLVAQQAFPRTKECLDAPVATTSSAKRTLLKDGNNITLKVIDTPDMFGMGPTPSEILEEYYRIDALTPSPPHVVLLTIRCDQRYTQSDHDFYQNLQRYLGPMVQNNLVLAFTHGERLRVGESIESVVTRVGSFLKTVYGEAKGRHLVFQGEGCFEVEEQTEKLLDYVDKIKEENRGMCALM